MLQDSKAYSGFSVNDQQGAKAFYEEKLGLKVSEDEMGLTLELAGGNHVFVYPKEDHKAASYTVLNFPVTDIDAVVDELSTKGVSFEHYNNDKMPQDKKGILRGLSVGMGPDIAWFKDPAGNIFSVLQETK